LGLKCLLSGADGVHYLRFQRIFSEIGGHIGGHFQRLVDILVDIFRDWWTFSII